MSKPVYLPACKYIRPFYLQQTNGRGFRGNADGARMVGRFQSRLRVYNIYGTAKPRAKRRKLLTRPVEASRATLKSDAYERQAIYYHSDNPAN